MVEQEQAIKGEGAVSEKSVIRSVKVEFLDETKEPKYTFTGRWDGRKVLLVRTLLPRAYRRYQKQVKEAEIKGGNK